MTDTVPTDDYAAVGSDADGLRQHASADVAPELYDSTTDGTAKHDPTTEHR